VGLTNPVSIAGIEVARGPFEPGSSNASAWAYSISDVPRYIGCQESVSEFPTADIPVCGERVELDVDFGGCVDANVLRGR
jgi:hypothetical protein